MTKKFTKSVLPLFGRFSRNKVIRSGLAPGVRGTPQNMEAAIVREFGPVSSVHVETVPVVMPARDEVLIEAAHASVSISDRLMIEGTFQERPQPPFSPGEVLAGYVRQVGADVSNIVQGNRAIVHVEYGAWRQFANVPAVDCSMVHDDLLMNEAVALGLTYQTAWFALNQHAHVKPGQHVLITDAAGDIGLAAIELVTAQGGFAIAGVRHLSQQTLVRKHGAVKAVDLSAPDLQNSLKAVVMGITGNQGVDIVLDSIGGDVLTACLQTVARFGEVVSISFSERDCPTVNAALLSEKHISMNNMQWTDFRNRRPHDVDRVREQLWKLFIEEKLNPPIAQCYPLEEFNLALDRIEQENTTGQVLLNFLGSKH